MTLSPYIHFHIGIGFTGVVFGGLALFIRAPDFLCCWQRFPSKIQSCLKIAHTLFGQLYLLCCLFMPITSNWIWPRYGTPYEVIFFIATMYIAIVLGILCIRTYKFLNTQQNQTQVVRINVGSASKRPEEAEACEYGNAPTLEGENNKEKNPVVETSETVATNYKHVWLKYLHSFFMIYSWVMLLGAGQAFLSNSRTKGFPYDPKTDADTIDSLTGRCFGRDLRDSSAPSWLTHLSCGMREYCQVSVKGGENRYTKIYSG